MDYVQLLYSQHNCSSLNLINDELSRGLHFQSTMKAFERLFFHGWETCLHFGFFLDKQINTRAIAESFPNDYAEWQLRQPGFV